MIEVVVHRTEHLQHYRTSCNRCKSELRFSTKDLRLDQDPAGRGEGSASLECPVCKSRKEYPYVNSESQFAAENQSILETQDQYIDYLSAKARGSIQPPR